MAAYYQDALIHGGKFVIAAPRSEGKTSISEGAVIWALLYGHSTFIIYVGASKEAAMDSFESIQAELESNEILLNYFPEAVYPIHRLEGQNNRSKGQLCNGERTHIEWRSDRIVFPTIPGSFCSGSILLASGYDGRLRGRKHKTAEGHNVRPNGIIFDDVQKDKTGKNPANADYLEKILKRTVKYLGTRSSKMSLIIPGTRLNPSCFMSRMLDRKRNPSYQGLLLKAIDKWPDNMELWKDYWKIWNDEYERLQQLPNAPADAWLQAKEAAADFYRTRRADMDAGAEISWPDNVGLGDVSGLQTLMNMYLEDEAGFLTEFQNEPQDDAGSVIKLTEDIWLSKIVPALNRGVVPMTFDRLTVGMDLHKNLIYWIVVAWGENFSGHIVDYGTFPKQPYNDFTVDNATITLESTFPGLSYEGQLYAGMEAICGELFARVYQREDGTELRIQRGLVDSNWAPTTTTIQTFIHRNAAFPLFPSRGSGKSLTWQFFPSEKKIDTRTPFSYLTKKQTDQLTQTVWVNTNQVKSFTLQRLVSGVGGTSTMTVFNGSRALHALLFNHLTSQYYESVSKPSGSYNEWKKLPGRTEDHWWDCLNLAVVANFMEGGTMDEIGVPQRRKRKVYA